MSQPKSATLILSVSKEDNGQLLVTLLAKKKDSG